MALRLMNYAIITPYFIAAGANKNMNLGDGFILDAITELLGEPPLVMISSRLRPTLDEIDYLNCSCRFVVLAGTNWLGKNFEIFSQSERLYEKISIPIIPIGVGSGEISDVSELSNESRRQLQFVLESSSLSSWRDRKTERLVRDLALKYDNIPYDTGCPVEYNNKTLAPLASKKSLLISTTTRGKFFKRDLRLVLQYSKKIDQYERVGLYFQQPVCQQNGSFKRRMKDFIKTKVLISIAVYLGLKIERPITKEHAYSVLSTYSEHIGTRLHVHLTFMAHSKETTLYSIDNRAVDYFANHFESNETHTVGFSDRFESANRISVFLENLRKEYL